AAVDLAAQGGAGGLGERGGREQHAAGQRATEQAAFEPAGRDTGLAVHCVTPPRAVLLSLKRGMARGHLLLRLQQRSAGCGTPHPVSGTAPQDARTTSRGCSSRGPTSSPPASVPASSRRRIASAPNSAISTRIVVSGGWPQRESGTSSKPARARSPGTRRPPSPRANRQPSAIMSLAAKTASGSVPPSSSALPARWPEASPKSPGSTRGATSGAPCAIASR